MADNSDEEHLAGPANSEAEKTPDEIISKNDIISLIPNQTFENMEIHHHAHHAGKKNWRSYLWEFLMLFLAVF